MKNGSAVRQFEARFAEYVGAKYAIALCNGTATLHTALVALGVKPGDRVAVPPLTMSSPTIAVLHAGAVPVFSDVDPLTWLYQVPSTPHECGITVSLYGLHSQAEIVDDAAQTLRPHGGSLFTSYSFQASKILALGEGGMLTTNDEALATRAREFSSLGYRMQATQPRIDKDSIKASDAARHYSLGWNYRMSDLVAREAMHRITCIVRDYVTDEPAYEPMDGMIADRREAAGYYRDAIQGVSWITPQHVPEGWVHDYWTYAVACDTPARANALADEIVRQGGERPYPCWKLTYREPAFRHLTPWRNVGLPRDDGGQAVDFACPVAESLQPRLLQFQTNDLPSAERNAAALRRAIEALT